MKTILTGMVAMGLAMSLVGCGENPNTNGGTVIGAVAGGLLGSQFGRGQGQVAAAIAGAVVGGYIGNRIGSYMDRQDKLNYQQAVVSTPVGQEATWTNHKTHATYTVRPVKQYHADGHICRRYRTTVMIDGRQRQAYGRACKDANGHWRIQG